MNQIGTYEQSFETVIRGLEFTVAKVLDVPDKNLSVSLAPSEVGIVTITIQIRNTSQNAGGSLARRIADDYFDELLLKFGAHVTETVAPKPNSPSFSVFDASGRETVCKEVSDVISISLGPTSEHTFYKPNVEEINSVTKRIYFHLITPQEPTSAQLYSAKRMFSIGMQSQDHIVRFLILYSATALAALFKWHSGKQENVDELFCQANPSIPKNPTGRNGKQETLYTKIRNDFIHAEERSVDPFLPMKEIQENLKDFQRDVSTVLNQL